MTAVIGGRPWALDQRFSASGDADAFALAGPSVAMPGGFWLGTATVDIVARTDSAGPLPEPVLLTLARRLRDSLAGAGAVPG